jgi:hypothetical protein
MGESMARRFIFVVIAAALLSPASVAQMRPGFRGSARGARGFGTSFGGHHRDAFARGYFVGDTAFFYDDYPFGPAMPEPAPPQFVVMQSPAAPPARIASLLIELQGNRYVRYGGSAPSAEATAAAREIRALEGAPRPAITPSHVAQRDLPPTVLVYRDGHREEVADYAIVGRIMYAHNSNNDDREASYGMKNIQLSALDISATMRTNREKGVNFALPAAPNEVVTRP